jgi:succinate dehydrogenase/fumarate reductase cytochrome b subunit
MFCKNWFSRHQRAEGEVILVFIHQQITSVFYRKPRNDVDFFALALLVIHYQNVIRLILWNYLLNLLQID